MKSYPALGVLWLMTISLPTAAFLEPSMERLENCYKAFTLEEREIDSLTKGRQLFINEFRASSQATDAQMLKGNGLSGFISISRLYRASPQLPETSQLLFTGSMYQRRSSLFENIFSNSDNKLFYEVELDGLRYLIRHTYLKIPSQNTCL